MSHCYLGIDLGTSACRAIAIDAKGTPIAHASCPLPASIREGAQSRQQAEDWWQAVIHCIHAINDQLTGIPVHRLAVDGTSASLLLTDTQGIPLSEARMYDDSAFVESAALIDQQAPEDSPARGPGSALAKLMGLTAMLPDCTGIHTGIHALHQADWITGKLSGRWGLSDENNTLKLGYDAIRRCWPDWMAALPIDLKALPHVVPSGQDIGPIDPEAATLLGLSAETRIVSGTTDSIAAFLATGASHVGDAVTSLGSTLVIKLLSSHPINAPEYGVYSHRLGQQWLVGGASNCGGATLLQFFSRPAMLAMTPQLRPSEKTGLDYYPLPGTGERFPVSDPEMQACLTPRPDSDTRFFQGILEGLARVEANAYTLLMALGAPQPDRILSTGGGAINPVWQQIRQDRIGIPVIKACHTESAYGMALLALKAP